MCEPTTIAVVTALGSAAATGMSMKMQQSAVNSQNAANNAWREYQKNQRTQEAARQDELRGKAEQNRQQGLEDLDPANQEQSRVGEEQRLTQEVLANTSVNEDVGGQLLSGARSGGEAIQTDLAKRLTQASADARKRLTALAGVQSYGASFNGMKNNASDALARSDQGINLANNMRQGSLAAYGIAKGVTPPAMQPTTDPYGGIASSLAGISGTAFGNAFGKTGTTAAPVASGGFGSIGTSGFASPLQRA